MSDAGSQSDQPLNDTGVQPPVNLPANSRGVPTPEALVAVLRLAERLFSGHAISALSVCTTRALRLCFDVIFHLVVHLLFNFTFYSFCGVPDRDW